MYRQDPPNAVQIELVEGCNLRCSFCGINGIRDDRRTYHFALLGTLQRIAMEIARAGWTSRIEFAMHGEPSLHPGKTDAVEIFRSELPKAQLMMTSNGGGFVSGGIDEIFDAGLNVLALDNYDGVKFVPSIIKSYKGPREIHYYPQEPDFSPHSRGYNQVIIVIEDISKAEKGTHSQINTHCGAGGPPEVLHQRCAKPFRELSFRWDGSVAICCNDWRGEYVIGNIHKMGLEEIWQHPRFMAARHELMQGRRTFTPCNKCNARSYRLGLLPDRMGKETMPPYDEAFIYEALHDGPLTKPVRRPWE